MVLVFCASLLILSEGPDVPFVARRACQGKEAAAAGSQAGGHCERHAPAQSNREGRQGWERSWKGSQAREAQAVSSLHSCAMAAASEIDCLVNIRSL